MKYLSLVLRNAVIGVFVFVCVSAYGSQPAQAATITPIVSQPTAASTVSTIPLEYTLPETPLSGSVKVTITDGVSLTRVLNMDDTMSVDVTINPAALSSTAHVNSVVGGATLPDGTYAVVISYQDTDPSPAGGVTVLNVTVDTVTEAPLLISPGSSTLGNEIHLTYSLPETPLSGSVLVSVNDGVVSQEMIMDDTASVDVVLDLSDLGNSEHVASSVAGGVPDGTYSISVEYQDALGNPSTTTTITGFELDTTAPTLEVIGESSVTITQGETYTDEGAQAIDVREGDLSSSVIVVNPVDANTIGEYTITYNITDAAGNAAEEQTRTVNVVAAEESESESHGAIKKLVKQKHRLIITYVDNTTQTITPFGLSSNFRAVRSTDKSRIVVTNGKEIRVYVDGERVARKKLNAAKYKRNQYALSVKNLYGTYDTIVVAAAKGKVGRVYVARLRANNTVVKLRKIKVAVQKSTQPKIVVHKTTKRIAVAVSKGKTKTSKTWKVTSDGHVRAVKKTTK